MLVPSCPSREEILMYTSNYHKVLLIIKCSTTHQNFHEICIFCLLAHFNQSQLYLVPFIVVALCKCADFTITNTFFKFTYVKSMSICNFQWLLLIYLLKKEHYDDMNLKSKAISIALLCNRTGCEPFSFLCMTSMPHPPQCSLQHMFIY